VRLLEALGLRSQRLHVLFVPLARALHGLAVAAAALVQRRLPLELVGLHRGRRHSRRMGQYHCESLVAQITRICICKVQLTLLIRSAHICTYLQRKLVQLVRPGR
jgi:hypothetical protein